MKQCKIGGNKVYNLAIWVFESFNEEKVPYLTHGLYPICIEGATFSFPYEASLSQILCVLCSVP